MTITNNLSGNYDFQIFRKEAITNVQINPHSSHDPKILQGVFQGYMHRAFTLCSDKYLEQELKFLKEVFVENGYSEQSLNMIISKTHTYTIRDTVSCFKLFVLKTYHSVD